MRIKGFEPPWSNPHTDLNRARLPIPPYPHIQATLLLYYIFRLLQVVFGNFLEIFMEFFYAIIIHSIFFMHLFFKTRNVLNPCLKRVFCYSALYFLGASSAYFVNRLSPNLRYHCKVLWSIRYSQYFPAFQCMVIHYLPFLFINMYIWFFPDPSCYKTS